MHIFYTSSSKEKINLAKKPIAKGGEGQLFVVRTPQSYQNSLAKIYHPHKLDENRTKKISYLLKHPIEQEEQTFFVWPKALLKDETGQGHGFLMPWVQGKKLELFCLPKLPKPLATKWAEYDLSHKKGRENRLKIAYRLSYALYLLQASGKYVLVDFKPENILLHENGQISIVDIDSIQISENGELKFMAPVATPEYSAPEYYREKIAQFSASWDNFALAVIIYKLLLGIHPYAATAKQKNLNSLHQNIKNGLFAHHPEAETLFEIRPAPHQAFFELPEKLQALFQQSFVAGHKRPELRPSPKKFCLAIAEELEDKSFYRQFLQKDIEAELLQLSLKKVVAAVDESPIAEKIEEQTIIPAKIKEITEWELPSTLNPQQHNWVFLEEKAQDLLNHKGLSASSGCLLSSLLSLIIPLFAIFYLHKISFYHPDTLTFFGLLFLSAFPQLFLWYFIDTPKQHLKKIRTLQAEMMAQREKYLTYWHFSKETIQPIYKNMQASLAQEIEKLSLSWQKKVAPLEEELSRLLEEEKESWRSKEKEVLPQLTNIHPLLQNVSSIEEAENILQQAKAKALANLEQQSFAKANLPEELSARAFEKSAKKIEAEIRQVKKTAQEQLSKLEQRKKKQLEKTQAEFERLQQFSVFLAQKLNWPPKTIQAFLNELQPFGLNDISQWQSIVAKEAALIGKSQVIIDLGPFIQKDSDYTALQEQLFNFQKVEKELSKLQQTVEDQVVLDQIDLAKKEKEQIEALEEKRKKLDLLGPEARRKKAIQQLKSEFNSFYSAILKQKYAVSQQLLKKRKAQEKNYRAAEQKVKTARQEISLAYKNLLEEQKLANEMILEAHREQLKFWDNPQLNNFQHLIRKARALKR